MGTGIVLIKMFQIEVMVEKVVKVLNASEAFTSL